jgi:penicillin-binding protein-related factor A (putative recombinase)
MNDLEAAFDEGYDRILAATYMKITQRDYPMATKAKQIVDRVLVSRDRNLAFELKRTKRKLLPFARIPDHQGDFLREFATKVGEAYLICAFLGLKHIFLLSIHKFDQLKESLEKKSFNMHDVDQFPRIHAIKLRTRYYLDLGRFQDGSVQSQLPL